MWKLPCNVNEFQSGKMSKTFGVCVCEGTGKLLSRCGNAWMGEWANESQGVWVDGRVIGCTRWQFRSERSHSPSRKITRPWETVSSVTMLRFQRIIKEWRCSVVLSEASSQLHNDCRLNWLLATGCWPLAAEYWLMAADNWILAANYWFLSTDCWLLTADYWQQVADLAIGYWLLAAYG
jgi:hypothetical protein